MKKPKRKRSSRAVSRTEVRKATHRVNVPRSSQRAVERSKQRRSKRP